MKPHFNPNLDVQKSPPDENLRYSSIDARAINPKLREFLEVMQPPSKSKIWANEDSTQTPVTSISPVEKIKFDTADNQSDEEYQHVSKKRKISPSSMRVPNKEDGKAKLEEIVDADKDMSITEDLTASNTLIRGDESPTVIPTVTTASDTEWLRSRTSRLLGLVDDDDALTTSHIPQKEDKDKRKNHDVDETSDLEPASISTIPIDGKQVEEATPDTKEPTQNTKETSSTGRLFVRNLSYTTEEADLREYFGKFGDLEEVRSP